MSAVDDARKAHEDLGNGPWATMAYLHALELVCDPGVRYRSRVRMQPLEGTAMSVVDDARKAHEDLGNGPWATMAYLHALEAENKLLDEARENANAATFKAETELEKAQWAIAQWHAQWQAEEEDWVRDRETCMEVERLLRLRLEKAEAEVARLNLLCDRLAAAGHS